MRSIEKSLKNKYTTQIRQKLKFEIKNPDKTKFFQC